MQKYFYDRSLDSVVMVNDEEYQMLKTVETIVKPGMLDVQMDYQEKGKKVNKHIVDNEKIMIGRNDDDGYYFKFGIYRVGNSTKPVCYNLANYSER